MVGSGVQDYGNILIVPTSKPMTTTMAAKRDYISRFSHARETAVPGTYSVFLETPAVQVDIAACSTTTAAYTMRWQSADSPTRSVIFDAGHCLGKQVSGSEVSVAVHGLVIEVSGWALMSGSLTGRAPPDEKGMKGVRVFFVARVVGGTSPKKTGVWSSNGTVMTDGVTIAGKEVGGFVEFPGGTGLASVAVAISLVSVAQARSNLAAVPVDVTVPHCSALADTAWDDVLGRVAVTAPSVTDTDKSELTKFFTALCVFLFLAGSSACASSVSNADTMPTVRSKPPLVSSGITCIRRRRRLANLAGRTLGWIRCLSSPSSLSEPPRA